MPKQLSRNNAPLVNYAYLADGTKYKAQGADGDGFVYAGSLRWRLKDGVLTPESVAITGGRAVCDTTDTWAANYYICDHLGSVRTVTDENGTAVADYDYLPYGTDMSRDATAADVTDYRFTGKEVQRDFGANLYDSFARFQHNNGRFLSIDPKAESFYHISPYAYCAGNPVNLVDPDGKDWYSITTQDGNGNEITSYKHTSYSSQAELDKNNISGCYLGEALVIINGLHNECLGTNGTIEDDDAITASFTIYGINGEDDIKTYKGLTVSSDPNKYSRINDGEYLLYHQQMATSAYAKDSKTYRIVNRDGSPHIKPHGGYNKINGKTYMEAIFFHRTNWSGKATSSSQGCLIVDARFWAHVEQQLGTSSNIYLLLNRK